MSDNGSVDVSAEFHRKQRESEGCFISVLGAIGLLIVASFMTCRYQMCVATYDDPTYCAYAACSKYPPPAPRPK